jgi:hypothetical protein
MWREEVAITPSRRYLSVIYNKTKTRLKAFYKEGIA